MSINRVVLLGNMTRDPELRRTGNGKAVTNFTLALNRYNNDEADFVDCVCWEKILKTLHNTVIKAQKLQLKEAYKQDHMWIRTDTIEKLLMYYVIELNSLTQIIQAIIYNHKLITTTII